MTFVFGKIVKVAAKVSCSGVSRAYFALKIFPEADPLVPVISIPPVNYSTPAKYSSYLQIDSHSAEQVFGVMRTNWQNGYKSTVKDLGVK